MTRCLRYPIWSLLWCIATPLVLWAEKPTAEEEKWVKDTFATLTAKMKPVPGYANWPPEIKVDDDDTISDPRLKDNAWATIKDGTRANPVPMVHITVPYLRRIQGDRDYLALTLGHELGHHYHGHILEQWRAKPDFAAAHFSRMNEYAADDFGADLMKAGGFSLFRALVGKSRAFRYSYHHLDFDLTSDHPPWDDRFARLAKKTGDPKV